MPPIDIREANEAWEALLTAHSVLMRRFADESIWRENGLTMREYDVLYTLSKYDQPARMGELSQGVLLSQPALSRLVDRLEARKLVERVADTKDGRAVRVTLTQAGSDVQRTVGRSHARSVGREMQALTSEERQELRRLAAKLAAS